MTPAALAGRVVLRPGVTPPHGVACERPDLLPRLAPGRRADEMPALLGSLFALCAGAHRLTAAAALRAARGEPTDAATATVTRRALRLGTAREQILRLSHDWPHLLRRDGGDDGGALMLRACPLWRDDLSGDDQLDALPGWLAHKWLGEAPAAWLQAYVDDPVGAPQRWVQRAMRGGMATPLARLLHRIGPDARALATPGRTLDVARLAWPALAAALQREPAFGLRPHLDGQAADTGPWRRRAETLPAGLTGATAWDRLIARLAEVLRLAGPHGDDWLAHGACPLGPGDGLAWCEMARGLLVHHARLDASGQRVTAWQVLAPTEWNFHPDGALARALAGVTDADGEASERLARLLAVAFDPCVEVVVDRNPSPGARCDA